MSLVTWKIQSDKTNVPEQGAKTSSKEVAAKNFIYYENFKMSVTWNDAPENSVFLVRLQVSDTEDIPFITPKELVSGTIYNQENFRNFGNNNTLEFIYSNRESPKSFFYTFSFWAFASNEDLAEFLGLVAESCEAPASNYVRQSELIKEYRSFVIKVDAVPGLVTDTSVLEPIDITSGTSSGVIDKSVIAGLRVLSLAEEAGLLDPAIPDVTFDPTTTGDPTTVDPTDPNTPGGGFVGVGLDPGAGDPIRVGQNLVVYLPPGSSVNGSGIFFFPLGRPIAKRYDRTTGVCSAHFRPKNTGGYIITGAQKTFCSTNDEPIAREGDIVKSDCGHYGYIDPTGSNNFIEEKPVARIYDTFSGTYRGYITGPGCPGTYADEDKG